MVEYTEWRLRCVVEEGFYIGVWRRRGNLRWRLDHEYGPLIGAEVFDVMDMSVSTELLRAALKDLHTPQ